MATFQTPARRLILAGGFAVAIAAAPAVAVFAVPTTSTPAPVAECAMGDVEDPATGVCMPAPAQGSLPAPVPTRVNALAWARSSSRHPSRLRPPGPS